MITAVVFSKNRACQLDLLLTSLEKNGGGTFFPVVLYRSTTDDHEQAYHLCQERHPHVPLQSDRANLVPLAALMIASGQEYGCFFTDDSVLYRRLPVRPRLPAEALCFSLRLGLNTTWCYPFGREQTVPPTLVKVNGLRWNWKDADGDFGYPASVDGHVFRGPDLANALADCSPDANPNQIEEHLVKHFKNDPRTMMASYPQSCLVGLPLNVVTDTHNNRYGERHAWSTDGLLSAYLAGKRIQLDKMDFTNVRGAHQEIELVLA